MKRWTILAAAVGCLWTLSLEAQAAGRQAKAIKVAYADPAPAASTPAPAPAAEEKKAEEKKEEEKKCNACARIPLFPPCKKKSECEEEKKEETCKKEKCKKRKCGKCEEVKCEEEKKEEKEPDPTNPCACDYKKGLLEHLCHIKCCGCEPACCKEPEPLFCKNWGKKKCDSGCATEIVVHEEVKK
jgi:hypothetical protein